ncbi:MAG: hypothetical protein ACTSQ8_17440 [Candidatus Helarchaeota archaeon]
MREFKTIHKMNVRVDVQWTDDRYELGYCLGECEKCFLAESVKVYQIMTMPNVARVEIVNGAAIKRCNIPIKYLSFSNKCESGRIYKKHRENVELGGHHSIEDLEIFYHDILLDDPVDQE